MKWPMQCLQGINPIEGSLAATQDVKESSRHDSQLQARSP